MRTLLVLTIAAAGAATPLMLDGSAAWHAWDGFGGLSAGASSRLLRDYAEPSRSLILDALYLPSYGAGLKICKIEIGGDVMSTDGTEPSHMHHRDDLSCDRGYELWLAGEALARNPAIVTFALSWGVPGWVGNGSFFSDENMHYQIRWCDCFLAKVGKPLDFIGIWNERSWGSTDYIVNLRATLDAAGHGHTKIVLPDCAVAGDPALLAAIANNATFGAAFAVAGLHGNPVPVPILEATGHRYWQSETGFSPISLQSDWPGAQDWARILARNYISSNITGTITWSTLWSVLPGLPYNGRGMMMANTPWSGSYNVSAPVWVSAHYGQFLEVGWRHLLTGRGAGYLPAAAEATAASATAADDAGSYVAFVPPDSLNELTLIVETINAPPSTRVFSLVGGLPGPGTTFCVWTTTNAARFVRGGDVIVAFDGTLTLDAPGDGLLTASTVCTATHGTPSTPVPPPAPFSLPYHDTFDEADCAYDQLPRFLSDQGGSFACRNGSLAQVVTQRPGANDWYTSPDPLTLLGDYTPWADVKVGATVTLPPSSLPRQRALSADDPNAVVAPCEYAPSPIASAQAWSFDAPARGYLSNAVGGESICVNLYGCEARMIYFECCTSCGCSDGEGFIFTLQPNASLTTPLLPGLCASVLPDNATVSMVPCAASALQQWAHTPSTRQLVNAGTRTCLTSSLQPEVPYARVCARISGYSGFDGLAAVPGYCLVVRGDGSWAVTAAKATLANGTLPSYDPSQPTALELTLAGDTVAASVGGVALGTWPGEGAFAGGMVALGSGVHEATFDNFVVQ